MKCRVYRDAAFHASVWLFVLKAPIILQFRFSYLQRDEYQIGHFCLFSSKS
jgi:hypothetical protein